MDTKDPPITVNKIKKSDISISLVKLILIPEVLTDDTIDKNTTENAKNSHFRLKIGTIRFFKIPKKKLFLQISQMSKNSFLNLLE